MIMRDSLWEADNNVAALLSPLAPECPDRSSFYGLYEVYPAALPFKRRQTGIATERTWQKCNATGSWLSVREMYIGTFYKSSLLSSSVTTDWPQIWIMQNRCVSETATWLLFD